MTTRSPTFSPSATSFGTLLSRGPAALPLLKASLDDPYVPAVGDWVIFDDGSRRLVGQVRFVNEAGASLAHVRFADNLSETGTVIWTRDYQYLTRAPFFVGDRVRISNYWAGTVEALTPDSIRVKWDTDDFVICTSHIDYHNANRLTRA